MSKNYVKPERLWLKTKSEFGEKWVQDRIAEDPSLLNLGDLVLRDRERLLLRHAQRREPGPAPRGDRRQLRGQRRQLHGRRRLPRPALGAVLDGAGAKS